MTLIEMQTEFKEALLTIDRYKAKLLFEENVEKYDLIETLIVPILDEIGIGWENGDYSLSQVYMSGVMAEELVNEFLTLLPKKDNHGYKLGIVTFDDYHTLGKKIIYMNLRSSGYDILDFGMIFDENKLIKLVVDNDLDLLLMSVLMLPPALKIKPLKAKLLAVKPDLKIMVGGAPFRFDKELYKQVDADAVGHNVLDIIDYLKSLEVSK